MLRRIVHAVQQGGILAAVLLLGWPGTASAQTAEFWLRAETVNMTLPGGRVIPMWGFALDTDGNFGTLEGVATVPGPALTVPAGSTGLTIHLLNRNIPEGVSVIIPGQASPTDGVTVGPQIARNPDGRARAFAHEVAAGGSADYVWDALRPGTYLYQSGSHPALQVQMGLYGALELDEAGGSAYGVAYTQDLTLVYSEIDPALHDAVAAGRYGPGLAVTSTLHYEPKYFLVNGVAYSAGLSPVPLGAAGTTTLLRFLNAGLETHLPEIVGAGVFTILAEDGNLAPYTRQAAQVELPPGKTVDATLIVPGPGYYPLYDRRLFLVNHLLPDGGMLLQLSVAAPASATLTVRRNGTGRGAVTMASAPGGINCGANCTETVNRGTRVTLRAFPLPGSLLTRWSGGGATCVGFGDCVTTMGTSKTVTATFTRFIGVGLLTPNGGERFREFSFATIRWGAPVTVASFSLHYSVNGGRTWTLIDSNLEGNSYVWRVPRVPVTRRACLVRVSGFSARGAAAGSDVSAAPFTIVNVP